MSGGESVTAYQGQYGGAGGWPYGGPPGVARGAGAADPTGAPLHAPSPARRRRRRRALVAVVAALAVAVVGTGVAVAHSPRPAGKAAASGPATRSASASTSDSPSAADLAAQDAAVQAVLDRRAAALIRGDLAGWLADVDPDQPALLAHQRMLFTNLRQLPLAVFRYTTDRGPDKLVNDVPATVSSTFTDYQGLYSPARTLQYQLRGFDHGPIADQYIPIFLRRGGRWLLAGDQTASQGDFRWVEPWDSEPIRVGRGRHSLVVVSGSDARNLPAMVSAADAALAKVAAMWPVGNHQVVLYDTRNVDVFATYLGTSIPTGEYDGVTRGLSQDSTRRATDDLRVVANPIYDPPGSSRLPALLRHEFTHVAKWGDQSDGTPLWASEGIAEYTAFRGHPSDQRVSGQIGKDANRGRLPRSLPTNQSFFANATASYDYGLAWCAFEYISETYSESKVRALYEAEAKIGGQPDSAAARAAQGKAFQTVLHVSESQFMRQLAAWIRQVLRPVG
jgi:hypothetical protein